MIERIRQAGKWVVRNAVLCTTIVVTGAAVAVPTAAYATDPPPVELADLGSSVDMGGVGLAMATKCAASYQEILLACAALAVLVMIGWFLFGATKKALH